MPLPAVNDVFKYAKSDFYAAGSFMSYQECKFNFGSEPFKYPPTNYDFKAFNDYGKIDDDSRKILPKFQRRNLIQLNTDDNPSTLCSLCYDNRANIALLPCQHSGFCRYCAMQLDYCPLCRSKIEEISDLQSNEESTECRELKETLKEEVLIKS